MLQPVFRIPSLTAPSLHPYLVDALTGMYPSFDSCDCTPPPDGIRARMSDTSEAYNIFYLITTFVIISPLDR
jgi:hypothetical protein